MAGYVAKVDAVLCFAGGGSGDERSRFGGEELLIRVGRLLSQFATIAEKQDAFGPAGPDHGIREADGNAGLAGAGGLDDKGFAFLLGELLDDPADGFDLVHAAGDGRVGSHFGDRFLFGPLEDQML